MRVSRGPRVPKGICFMFFMCPQIGATGTDSSAKKQKRHIGQTQYQVAKSDMGRPV